MNVLKKTAIISDKDKNGSGCEEKRNEGQDDRDMASRPPERSLRLERSSRRSRDYLGRLCEVAADPGRCLSVVGINAAATPTALEGRGGGRGRGERGCVVVVRTGREEGGRGGGKGGRMRAVVVLGRPWMLSWPLWCCPDGASVHSLALSLSPVMAANTPRREEGGREEREGRKGERRGKREARREREGTVGRG